MKLSKEQTDALADKLTTPWGRVGLRCDGYDVTLQVQRFKGMTYRVMTYVNGEFRMEWVRPENNAPESKFFRKRVTPNISPARRATAEKHMGKRYVKNDPFLSGSSTLYLPDWASGKAALSHLCRVCDSVEVIEKTKADDLGTVGGAIFETLG